MVEHHVNKFGPRRRTEGCLLLIFGLRAASKESTKRWWRETPSPVSPTMFGLHRRHRGGMSRMSRSTTDREDVLSFFLSSVSSLSLPLSHFLRSNAKWIVSFLRETLPRRGPRRGISQDIGWQNCSNPGWQEGERRSREGTLHLRGLR